MSKQNTSVGFILHGIKTEQFAVFEENYSPKKETALNTQLQFRLNRENRQIGSFLGLEFVQGKKVFMKIVVSCHFRIQEDSWQSFLKPQKALIIVPKGFLAHLAMITTGTSRGILFEKTQGSVFAKFIVPTLNVVDMIPKDISWALTEE